MRLRLRLHLPKPESRVEAYLTHDPFDAASVDDDLHPWRQVEANVSNEMLRRHHETEFAAVDWAKQAE